MRAIFKQLLNAARPLFCSPHLNRSPLRFRQYTPSFALLPSGRSAAFKSGSTITDTTTLAPLALVHACPFPGQCASNAIGLNGTGCATGAYGPLCSACKWGYFSNAGTCDACQDSSQFVKVVLFDLGVFLGVALALVLTWWFVTRTLQQRDLIRKAEELDGKQAKRAKSYAISTLPPIILGRADAAQSLRWGEPKRPLPQGEPAARSSPGPAAGLGGNQGVSSEAGGALGGGTVHPAAAPPPHLLAQTPRSGGAPGPATATLVRQVSNAAGMAGAAMMAHAIGADAGSAMAVARAEGDAGTEGEKADCRQEAGALTFVKAAGTRVSVRGRNRLWLRFRSVAEEIGLSLIGPSDNRPSE